MPMARRALLDDRDFAGSEPVVLLSCCQPLSVRAGGCTADAEYFCEAAGAAFAKKYEWEESDGDDSSEDDDGEREGDGSPGEEYGSKKKGGKDKSLSGSGGALKMSDALKKKNLYELLSTTEGASQEELKKAYRVLCLIAHPDKVAAMEDEKEAKKVQERFVMIQEAYEILSDPSKRMQYDSTLDFDESVPKFKEGQDFFKVFTEAFKRNARFSVKRPVPELGSMEDEPRVWKRFYDFWYDFQSWRDPVILAQKAGEEICDLEDAECREEKRWMMRENARVAKVYAREEKERISKLVNLAESFDPRVLAEKEAKQAARKAEMARREEERTAAKRAKDEAEKLKREAEEAERAAAEQKRREEKAAKDAIKERIKKCRQRLRSFHPAVKDLILLDQLNEVCLQLQEEQLVELGDKVEKALGGKAKSKPKESAAALLCEAIQSIGLTPVAPQEDEASTSSGPASQEDLEINKQKEEQRLKKAKENEAKRKKEEEQHAAERAVKEAEKAEERKKKEEQKKKEQAAAEVAKRQEEKKEQQKAKKQEEKAKKQEEQEVVRKEQQKEECKQRALEQAEQAKAANQAKQQEMEMERQVQLFTNDRTDRLNKLDPLSDEQLTQALQDSLEADAGLAGALQLLRDSGEEEEVWLDRVMALVSELSAVWHLGLVPPAEIRPPNAIRNRGKTARNRLRKIASTFASSCDLSAADLAAASDWQQGIADGSIELPVWSAKVEEEKPAAAASVDSPTAPGGKKKKKPAKAEENLDDLLAEFGVDSPAGGGKKSGKKKK